MLFGLGQLCNIAAQLQLAAFHWSAAAALAGLLTLAIALKGIGQWNTSANDPWLTIYTVLVATTAAKSLSTAIVLTGTTGGILLGAGGLLFFLSDMVLGIWNYQKPHILLADLNWLLYFAGQFMLCAGYIAAVRYFGCGGRFGDDGGYASPLATASGSVQSTMVATQRLMFLPSE